MKKTAVGPMTLLYPKPALLIGANIEGKSNFMTVAWAGIANQTPPMLSVAIRWKRYTFQGIEENRTFSVNIPSEDQVTETDYCGLVSGVKNDKVAVCGFTVFYGKLNTAPLIEQCPINLECSLVKVVDFKTHALCIGQIEEVHVSDDCLTDGKPDVEKVRPLVYSSGLELAYYGLGKKIAPGFQVGKKLMKRKKANTKKI
jgi:flavin reductase (DIM6/NTAB) family NADH-FMN oxidoreductase RutF